ncbi:unnamed protein product [Darwinula stevensoni]|uniref:Serine/threonine-protein kinase PLK n=1 Tax=Darwinula stevensoni TaxID=69355 RepID=A0A7R9A4P1_9CRUS|nr:unnamed protein product [Darwinula stevensoni]CAG0890418.1 unnamed protein product [Darwinula stevensoni]
MASTARKVEEPKIPPVIENKMTKRRYTVGKFLGKGGFAKCYELIEEDTHNVFAGKVVPKTLLQKQHSKEKMAQEIEIHRSLDHPHIVGFKSFFEDENFVFVILEMCSKKSLMELHKRRRALTEPEVRYYMRQICFAVKFLHDTHIIHRDLKLGNLFLNDAVEVKVGDFGLATRVNFEGERKRTLCGTPNYIAPEILCKKGHSYEVDIWSLGCILYTLLVGKPPFETKTLNETYSRIKRNKYTIPPGLDADAALLIRELLQDDPKARPNISQVLDSAFLQGENIYSRAKYFSFSGFCPPRLPSSCLTTAPRFDAYLHGKGNISIRRPLNEVQPVKSGMREQDTNPIKLSGAMTTSSSWYSYIQDLKIQVEDLLSHNPSQKKPCNEDEAEQPSCAPLIWISKWVDYSDKYGLGYSLSDDSIGVFFNDRTKLLLLRDGENLHYIEKHGEESYHTLKQYDSSLNKKVTLLTYFHNYMKENLVKTGPDVHPREGDELSRIPNLSVWFRTRSGIIMFLSNGTLQINFFQDHTKIILCPLVSAVTFITKSKDFRTFSFEGIKKFGCSKHLEARINYALTMINKIIEDRSGSMSRDQAKVPGTSGALTKA